MKHEMRKRIFCSIALAVLMGLGMSPAAAQKELNKAREEAADATQLLTGIMADPTKSIPRSMLGKAKAIAVFNNVKKGGFIIGGTRGDGVIARRTGKTWGPPVFYEIGGMDVGFQIGAKEADVILLFMTDEALNKLLGDEMELTAGLGLTAGPVGNNAGATTGKNSNIYVYARSSGAFAGATIGGGTIKANNSINEDVYKLKGGAIMTDPSLVKMSTLPAELKLFSSTLAKYSK